MNSFKLVLLIIIANTFFNALSQKSFMDIDLYRIPQKKVRQLISDQINSESRFEDINVSFKPDDDTAFYRKVNKLYLIKENISEVWNNYLTPDLSKVWNGRMVSFGILIIKDEQNICYRDEININADTGQVLYLNLKLLKGIYNLAVAFEITRIDTVKKIIVFNYIEGGKSSGEQILKFRSTPEGYTEIEHKTFFRSNSKFRDKRLYPFFHLKAIDEFHENILRASMEKVKSNNLTPEVGVE